MSQRARNLHRLMGGSLPLWKEPATGECSLCRWRGLERSRFALALPLGKRTLPSLRRARPAWSGARVRGCRSRPLGTPALAAPTPASVGWPRTRRVPRVLVPSRSDAESRSLLADLASGDLTHSRSPLPSMLASAGGNGTGVGFSPWPALAFFCYPFRGPLAKTLLLDDALQKRRRESALTFAWGLPASRRSAIRA